MFKPYCKKRRLLAFTLLITITITKINVFSYPAEYSDQQTPLLGSFSSKILQKKRILRKHLIKFLYRNGFVVQSDLRLQCSCKFSFDYTIYQTVYRILLFHHFLSIAS